MNEGLLAMGTDYEVRDMDFYKRAVLKPAPTCFTVEVLPPTKQGKAYSYGVRIIPVNAKQIAGLDTDADSDNTSVRSLNREYEIWRRWDDCLDFQSKLEMEYERMSRDKRRGLISGKAKKARGIYNNPNAASSFDSLPEGPDKKSISVDVHAHVPKLTRKNSFFSASDAAIQKRGEEFAAMIYALFKADCPRLIMELRDSPNVRDFFGWWRRDKELWEKVSKRPGTANAFEMASRVSVSDASTLMASPPSPDSPGFSILKPQAKPTIHRAPSVTSSRSPTSPQRPPSPSLRSESVVSVLTEQGEKALPSPPTSPERRQGTRSPMPFLRPGSRQQRPQISRPMPHPLGPHGAREQGGLLSPPADPVPRAHSPATANRIGRLFDALEVQQVRAQNKGDASSDSSSTPPATPTRDSYGTQRGGTRPMSTASLESLDSSYDIDLSFIKVNAPPPGRNRKRDSVASFSSLASVRTTDSADAIIPLRRGSRVMRRRTVTQQQYAPDSRLSVAVPEEEELEGFYDDDEFDDSCSYLDNIDAFPDVPNDDESEYIPFEYDERRRMRQSFPASIAESEWDEYPPSSPTVMSHTESVNSAELAPGTCSVKAKYDECIVALRIPTDTALAVLRARLVDKFAQSQNIALRARFGLAYIPPSRQGQGEDGLPIILSPSPYTQSHRPASPESVYAGTNGSLGLTRLVQIWNQDDWELALDSCGGKIVLHIFDAEVR
ncbi:hypothetical protein EXIGLDRAFT_748501 [Exidia glandulosa HHB12029]|uniref:PX domain-containing protein n=1 Tax=Exidia glandulosa HHB12029 TaxID=1314781 RepID=A0A165JEA9_EXIGL|nr:hypothetical protein EXIGLDRAFT_748501 [Exidia glandulosa HHB12029]